MEIIVVGGGVIGLAVAWELASRGAEVRLLERGVIGEGTSWAAAGILPAAPSLRTAQAQQRHALDELRAYSHELYPLWAEQIRGRSGIDIALRRCGGLYLASTPGEAASLAAALEDWRSDGIAAQRLSPEQLAYLEPALEPLARSGHLRAAARVAEECQVRPPDLLRGLAAAAAMTGVRIEQHADVRIARRGDAAVLCGTAGEDLAPHRPLVVLCGGVWSGQAAEDFGLGMSIVPIRGQMLLYRFSSQPFSHIINEGHRYLVPREDGHVLVGSCEEEVGFQLGTTPQMITDLARWAEGVAPQLRSMKPVRTWSGLRPATFDGYPMIGRVPPIENLFVAAGHYRSGIHLAPATAQLIADLVEGKRPAVDPAAFAAGRMCLQRFESTAQ